MKLMGTVRLRQMKEWEKYIYLERERGVKNKGELNLKGKPGDVTCLIEFNIDR